MSGVSKRSIASAAMMEAAAKGRALMGGTKAMRAAGKTYLPKFAMEEEENYKARLNSSWLFNGYKKTVRDMTGRVFDKPVELGADVPEQITDWCANVDLQGRDLSSFAVELFKDAMSGPGVSYIMVDAPRREGDVSRAQAAAMNLRPYMVHLRAEDILGWKTHVVGNVTKLSQIRIAEEIHTDGADEFTQETKKAIRVLDVIEGRVTVRLFVEGEKGEYAVADEYVTGLDEITVIPFYAARTGFFTGEPILDDLSDVNIAHWQSQSDQRNILHVARVPILFAAGFHDDDSIVVGSSNAVKVGDTSASLSFVEHSGGAIGAGRQDLKDLEFQMETYGLQLLVARDGGQSATGEALDAKKETSQLAMIADALQDALEQALMWMAEMGGVQMDAAESVVTVNKEFGVNMMTAQDVTAMLAAVNTGSLSRRTFIAEMTRRGFLRPDIIVEDELDLIDQEGGDAIGE